MANIPAVNEGLIQEEETQFKAGVSEYAARRMGSNMNFVLTNHVFTHAFKMNGPASSFAGKTGVDGLFVFPYDAEIINAIAYVETPGTGGTMQLNLSFSPAASPGSYTSIFATQPQITSSAVAGARCGVGDSVSGCTAPVLTASSVIVNEKDGIKMDVTSMQTGFVANCGIVIFYRMR